MRDPKRIPEILNTLQEIWEKVPDWRFFQLISNIPWKDMQQDSFYYEDDKTLASLKAYLDKFKE
jgi:uncharacterized protein YihD (DUF1040 family)